MAGLNLSIPAHRLKVVEFAFAYPMAPHQRKHGPTGYKDYESYREWLRDEFSYRCVFSLMREAWTSRPAEFDIDHFCPQSTDNMLVCDYNNLLYLRHRINLRKGKLALPDPGKIALGKCLRVESAGPRIGYVTPLTKEGQLIVEILKLNHPEDIKERQNWLELLRAAAVANESLFRRLVGFPDDLPNLASPRRKVRNTRPEGIAESAYYLREVSRSLPDWY